MSSNSKIEWTDRTWNPVTGCKKVSTGCANCYAERDWKRLSANSKTVYFGRKFTDVKCHPELLEQPLHWRKPAMVFVNSMSDLFHPDVPFEFFRDVLSIIMRTPQHTYQVLTKRPERILEFLEQVRRFSGSDDPGGFPPNLWLGVSVEDQATANERIPTLLRIPAAVRFVSAEPLLGDVDLHLSAHQADIIWRRTHGGDFERNFLHWVIVGGESGVKARAMHPDWVRSIRDQCQAAGVPFFFKQWGEWAYIENYHFGSTTKVHTFPDGQLVARFGRKAIKDVLGRTLDGKEWNEMPAESGEFKVVSGDQKEGAC